jgi:anti-sigma factor RsiW
MVDAYVDGELSSRDSAEFERALESCPECQARLDTARKMSGLLRELPAERTPDLLRGRIERELRTIVGTAVAESSAARATPSRNWTALAASLFLAAALGWLGGSLSVGRFDAADDEFVSTYLRVASSDHAVDVASTDRHTVRPWFAGRIDYSPPVHDLTSAGFPLEGGRIDVVAGRKVAVLVYRRNQHRIALSLWPASGANSTASIIQRDGFALADWRHGGFEMHAVSDLAPSEMAAFATALDRAIDADR